MNTVIYLLTHICMCIYWNIYEQYVICNVYIYIQYILVNKCRSLYQKKLCHYILTCLPKYDTFRFMRYLPCLANRCQVTLRSIPGPSARSPLRTLKPTPAPQLQHASAMCTNVSWLIAGYFDMLTGLFMPTGISPITRKRPPRIEKTMSSLRHGCSVWLCWAQRIPKDPKSA